MNIEEIKDMLAIERGNNGFDKHRYRETIDFIESQQKTIEEQEETIEGQRSFIESRSGWVDNWKSEK